jgi:hypothetical protein
LFAVNYRTINLIKYDVEMKKLNIVLVFAFLSSTGFAQQNGLDSVYLKSGSLLVGKMLLSLNHRIVIKTADNRVHAFSINDVFKISNKHAQFHPETNDSTRSNSELTDKKKEISTEKSSFKTINRSYAILEGSYGIGLEGESFHVLKLDLIGSYNISGNFNFGVGAGYRNYISNSGSMQLIPLYADFRFLLKSYRYYNFFAIDVGYSADITSNIYPIGYYLNPSFNVCAKIVSSEFLLAGIGCEVQNNSFYGLYNNHYNLYVSLGIMF